MTRIMEHEWLLAALQEWFRVFWSYVRWWTSHSYRIECDYEAYKDRGPIAYVKYEGEKLALTVQQYNGSAYLLGDGRWYGPQHLREIVTLRWHAGDSKF